MKKILSRPNKASRQKIVDYISEKFLSGFPVEIEGPRTVGREAEYPVVFNDAHLGPIGEAADITPLMKRFKRVFTPFQCPT